MSKVATQTNQSTGAYKQESIKDVAELLGLTVTDPVASALASDVEYRIHQVVQEAARFMRHGRRTTMTTSDIDNAFRVLNIEPLYGHTPHNPPAFRRAPPFSNTSGGSSVYFVEDEEIDFDRVLTEEKIALPKAVSWHAHWLAVEGVQPLIPENPPAIPKPDDTEAPKQPAANGTTTTTTDRPATKKQQQQLQVQNQLVKQVLSRELQLYYARLTSSLTPPSADFAKRTAALASLRNDAGLQALIPYLIRWVGEGVVATLKDGPDSDADGQLLQVYVDVIGAMLENKALFIEPYLHQVLPPLLSTLLHSSLPLDQATQLRTSSAQTLSRLLTQHSTTYPSLSPRIMKTLLLALISPGKSTGTREGAIRGLIGVGKEAIRKGLVEGGGAKSIANENNAGSLSKSVMDALEALRPESDMVDALDTEKPEDQEIANKLRELLGDFFAERLFADSAWAYAIAGKE